MASPFLQLDFTRPYAIRCFIDGGGSAISTDTAPNSAAPPADRVARLPNYVSTSQSRHAAIDGTTITLVPWIYDDSRALWVAYSAGIAATTASGPVAGPTYTSDMAGAKIFFQVTANTLVTKAAVFL